MTIGFERYRVIHGARHLLSAALALILSGAFSSISAYAAPLKFSAAAKRATGSWPEAVAVGDVNGDSRSDVVLSTSTYFDEANDYHLFVFLQKSDGTLDNPTKYPLTVTSNSGYSLDIGDFNSDQRIDVAVAVQGGFNLFLQQSDGSLSQGSFIQAQRNEAVRSLRVGDFNNDTKADIALIYWLSDHSSEGVEIFLQQTNGGFVSSTVRHVLYSGYNDLEVGDINNDGLTDIIVMSGQSTTNQIGVLVQQSGGFQPVVYYSLPDLDWTDLASGISIGDLNNDGRQDLAISTGGNRPNADIVVLYQNSQGLLEDGAILDAYDIPEPVDIADLDQDGRKDIITAHGGWTKISAYLQGSSATFSAYNLFNIPYASHYNRHGMTAADFNGDTYPDIAIADYNNGLVVLYNQSAPTPTPQPTSTPQPEPTATTVPTKTSAPPLTPGPTKSPAPTTVPTMTPNPAISVTAKLNLSAKKATLSCTVKQNGKGVALSVSAQRSESKPGPYVDIQKKNASAAGVASFSLARGAKNYFIRCNSGGRSSAVKTVSKKKK